MKSLTINGTQRETGEGTIADLLKSIDVHPQTVVVEYNGKIIPRSEFDKTEITEGSCLEIVQMMAGG